MRRAAFFDMDETLLSVNSARLWVEHMWRGGRLSKRDLVRSVASLVGYRLALVDMEKIARDGVQRLAGTAEDALREEILAWYEAEIRATIRPAMREVVERHRADGDVLVLLTASSPYVALPLAEELGIAHHLSTRFEVLEGTFTGRLEAFCYGEGKVTMSEAWARAAGVDLDASWFYSDSFTDLPMLERVGNPVAVHPDPRLLRWARQKGVAILQS